MIGILISSIISLIIGIAVSFYFSNRRKISYMIEERRVLDPAGPNLPDEVQIVFSDMKIERLSEWRVALWNSGNQTILATDVIGVDPLRLVLSGHNVLKVGEAVTGRAAIEARVKQESDDSVSISFSYLDKRDALAFTVYTCPSGETEHKYARGAITGSVVGISRGPKKVVNSEIMGIDDLLPMIFVIIMFALGGWFFATASANIATVLGLAKFVTHVDAGLVPDSRILAWLALVGSTLMAIVVVLFFVLVPFMLLEGLRPMPKLVSQVFELSGRFSPRRLLNLFPVFPRSR